MSLLFSALKMKSASAICRNKLLEGGNNFRPIGIIITYVDGGVYQQFSDCWVTLQNERAVVKKV